MSREQNTQLKLHSESLKSGNHRFIYKTLHHMIAYVTVIAYMVLAHPDILLKRK